MELRVDGTSRRWNFEEMELRGDGTSKWSSSILDFDTRVRVSSSSVEFEYRVLRTEHRTIEYRTLELDINSYLHVVPNLEIELRVD